MKTNILYWIILFLVCANIITAFMLVVSSRNNRWLNAQVQEYKSKQDIPA